MIFNITDSHMALMEGASEWYMGMPGCMQTNMPVLRITSHILTGKLSGNFRVGLGLRSSSVSSTFPYLCRDESGQNRRIIEPAFSAVFLI